MKVDPIPYNKHIKYSRDAEDALAILPEFPGRRFVRPSGYLVYVDNDTFIAEAAATKIAEFFDENGLGANACILKQGLIKYAYTDDKGEQQMNWWPMIYIDSRSDRPPCYSRRRTLR